MKKVIITSAFIIGTTIIYAQKTDADKISKVQTISKEDPHNPLVNGIPYNQYKVQVQAADKQRAAQETQAKKENEAYKKQNTDIKLPPKPTMVD
ncbi:MULTISPECIES: hypothetical protein [unclassified Kaistella]|uniref:hypothetical protein n=1 Tax=unclassified Kaistella TaxID=2762626 RepID=UPI002735A12C|nr:MULTISPECIES: hypothetical protein [unclassified Kaistella]MDP2453114.1 hypothetical protein [Kaistella sp. SH11-4b]MDP2456171.1 hypothetical protein [Kaistella sp. SH40-3]MDP2458927.1 hypothetical protein [Kaistella sp. SH19-2b]